MGTEYPELFECIDRLDKEMDVQAALIEGLVDQVAALTQDVLQQEQVTRRAPRKSKNQKGTPTPSMPPEAS